jgi:hypothetical protein
MRDALLLATLVVAGPVLAGGPDIYIRATATSPSVVEVIVGNSGSAMNTANFDASMIVRTRNREVCRLHTNFVTPLDAGMAVTTFRLDGGESTARVAYFVDVSVHFWDESRSADALPANNRHRATFVLPGNARCTTLKPVQ